MTDGLGTQKQGAENAIADTNHVCFDCALAGGVAVVSGVVALAGRLRGSDLL